MFGYLISFIFGVYIAQEYNLPSIKKNTVFIYNRFEMSKKQEQRSEMSLLYEKIFGKKD